MKYNTISYLIGEGFKNLFKNISDIRRSGSAALDLCYVAAGRLDGFLERSLKPWDYTAGSIILQEAGGTITDWDNKEIDYAKNSDILCSNGKMHQDIVDLVRTSVN